MNFLWRFWNSTEYGKFHFRKRTKVQILRKDKGIYKRKIKGNFFCVFLWKQQNSSWWDSFLLYSIITYDGRRSNHRDVMWRGILSSFQASFELRFSLLFLSHVLYQKAPFKYIPLAVKLTSPAAIIIWCATLATWK